MGTTTWYAGQFVMNKKLDASTQAFLIHLAQTKRMKRHVNPRIYGVEGEFYVLDDHEGVISDSPPVTQPGRWLHWIPTQDGLGLKWDGGEKFYEDVAWLEYLLERVLKGRGYTFSGIVNAEDETGKQYHIEVKEGTVTQMEGLSPYVEIP